MTLSWNRLAFVLALVLLPAGTLPAQFRAVPSAPSGGFGRGVGGIGGVRSGGSFIGGGNGGGGSKPGKTPFDSVVKELTPLLQKGAWQQAGEMITEKLGGYAPAQQALHELLRESQQVARLERLRAALTAPPGEAHHAWQRVALGKLPESFRPSARLLAALATFHAEARRTGSAGDPEDLQEALADFRQLARNPGPADRVCFDLAAHSLLAGNGEQARRLLHQAGRNVSSGDAVLLLMDLKTLMLGEGGMIHTDVARRALSLRPATGGAAVRGPPSGIVALLPPEERGSWRAPVPTSPSGPSLVDRSLSAFFNGQGALARKLLASAADVPSALAEARLRDLKAQFTGEDEEPGASSTPPGGGWPYSLMPFAEVRAIDIRAGIDEDPLRFLDRHDAIHAASFQAPGHR
jgi:hypothetical protein